MKKAIIMFCIYIILVTIASSILTTLNLNAWKYWTISACVYTSYICGLKTGTSIYKEKIDKILKKGD